MVQFSAKQKAVPICSNLLETSSTGIRVDVRCLLTLEFLSMMTDKWRGGIKRPWRSSHAEACELLQKVTFLCTE